MAKPAFTDQQAAQMCARFLSGETVEALAKSLSVGTKTIDRYLRKANITAEDRNPQADDGPPSGWDELVTAVTSAPKDPIKWAGWAREALTEIAVFRLRHPSLPREFGKALEEFRKDLKEARNTQNEDMIAKAVSMLQDDADEMDDPGPPVRELGTRKRRKPRKT